MAILGSLSLVTGLCMIIVCIVVCKKNRGKVCNFFNIKCCHQKTCDIKPSTKRCGTIHTRVVPVPQDFNSINKSLCTGTVELLELIDNNRDKIKLWRGNYEGSRVCVKTFKSSLHDMWANEISLYSLPNISSEFVLHFVGCQQKDNVSFYILTEYHPLGSLNDYLKCNTVNLLQAIQILHTASLGLAHLHSNSVIDKTRGSFEKKYAIAHRDVQSANVFVKNHDGQCVLGEFSQSLVLNPNATKYTIMNLNRKRKV